MTKAEREHVKRLEQYVKELERLYVKAVNEAALSGASLPKFDKSKPFAFADHPAVDKRIKKTVKQLHDSFVKLMEKSITTEWGKGVGLVDDAVAGTLGDEFVVAHNRSGAASAFIKRKENGMNLSQRVWKYVDQFKQEMEMGIDLGLRNGQSAAEMSRDLRKYLRDPNMLFRRVSDEHGNLHLSQRAKAYHPGQGVYRSSYKNAMRLARTEINMAYRTAGHDAAQDEDMIVGIEIHLSNNHNCLGIPNGEFYDICDVLAGKYPKDFKFVGWHPNCRCYTTFILMTDEELKARRKALLNGEEPPKIKSKNEVTDVPENFKKWLDRNRERVKTTTSIPYFIKDNGKYIPKDWVDGIGSLAHGRNKGIVADVREAIIKMKDPTFVTEREVRSMIEKYAAAEPGDFYGGLAGVKMSKANDGAMMSCERLYHQNTGAYAFQNGNTIRIYKTDHIVIDPLGNTVVFNPLHEVKEAMKSIAAQIPLSFNQEYAIESLWHEIRHAGAIGWKDIRKQTEDLTAAMECINQFCARRSYGKFLRAIGGSVSHKKEIIKSGYGYSRSVRHFEEMLAALNVSSSAAYAHFSKMIMVEPYENIFGNIVQFLVGKGVDKKKAEMLVKTLRHSDDMFGKVLTGA